MVFSGFKSACMEAQLFITLGPQDSLWDLSLCRFSNLTHGSRSNFLQISRDDCICLMFLSQQTHVCLVHCCTPGTAGSLVQSKLPQMALCGWTTGAEVCKEQVSEGIQTKM